MNPAVNITTPCLALSIPAFRQSVGSLYLRDRPSRVSESPDSQMNVSGRCEPFHFAACTALGHRNFGDQAFLIMLVWGRQTTGNAEGSWFHLLAQQPKAEPRKVRLRRSQEIRTECTVNDDSAR